jgi:hypothetical protein
MALAIDAMILPKNSRREELFNFLKSPSNPSRTNYHSDLWTIRQQFSNSDLARSVGAAGFGATKARCSTQVLASFGSELVAQQGNGPQLSRQELVDDSCPRFISRYLPNQDRKKSMLFILYLCAFLFIYGCVRRFWLALGLTVLLGCILVAIFTLLF